MMDVLKEKEPMISFKRKGSLLSVDSNGQEVLAACNTI